MPLRILEGARNDVRAARRRRETAQTRARFDQELRSCYAAIQKAPSSFARYPDAADPRVRVAMLRTMPYYVLLYDDPAETLILGVLHVRSGPVTVADAMSRD